MSSRFLYLVGYTCLFSYPGLYNLINQPQIKLVKANYILIIVLFLRLQ